MAARADSMATIDNALSSPSPATTSSVPAPEPEAQELPAISDDPHDPHAAPPVPGSKEEKAKAKADKEQEKADAKAKADKEQADAAAKARSGAQVDALTGVARSTFETEHPMGLDYFKLPNISSTIESIPTPGSFMFPLILLLLAFFVLIPVNGNTRVVWMWKVIAGTASIPPHVAVNPNIPFGPPTGTSPEQPTPMSFVGTLVEGA